MATPDPILVHLPADLTEAGGDSYTAVCTGHRTRTPSTLKVRRAEDGPYIVVGPHERYFTLCKGCTHRSTGSPPWSGGF